MRQSERELSLGRYVGSPPLFGRSLWHTTLVVLTLTATSCSTEPESIGHIATDTSAYRLTEQPPGVYEVAFRVEITNASVQTVYLSRACGYGDETSRHLERADGDTTEIWLGLQVCITRPLRKPIPVRGGETYVDEFRLRSLESPHANPPITMAMRTGTFRFVYHVQRTDEVGGWWAVDLLPIDVRRSNKFQVDPPESE